MAKTMKIVAILGCIHIGESEHIPGGPAFDCDQKEAKRLIDLGVAAVPSEKNPAGPTPEQLAADEEAKRLDVLAAQKEELLAAIAAAETTEALMEIMPKDQPDDEIAAAFVARMTELEGA